jgi:hypothetical protein
MSEPEEKPKEPQPLPSIFDNPPPGMELPPEVQARRIREGKSIPLQYRSGAPGKVPYRESVGCGVWVIALLIILALVAILIMSICGGGFHP